MLLFRFVTLLLTTFLLLTACQREIIVGQPEPGNPNGPSGSGGTLQANVNGVQWTATVASAARMQGLINISGFSTDKKYLTITLTDSGLHRYILSDDSWNAAALMDSMEANLYSYTTNQGEYPRQAGGEVTITAIDNEKKTISGRFAFKVFREMDGAQKTITEGSFTNLPYHTTLPPALAKDTFEVKIDGASWVPTSISAAAVPMMNQIAVNAANAAGSKAVGIVFPSNITAGSYTLDLFGGTYIGQYNPDLDPAHAKASVSGTLTILEYNTATRRIRGRFNFRAEELLNPQNFATISDGYFSVGY